MSSSIDLTSLTNVRAWLGLSSQSGPDPLLSRLITTASAFATNYLGRRVLGRDLFNETYDGYGNSYMMLRQFPVLSVASIKINANGTLVPVATGNPLTSGYVLDADSRYRNTQQKVRLIGSVFPRQRSAIDVSYYAGFVNKESFLVPGGGGGVFTPTRFWLEDDGAVDSISGLPVAYTVTTAGVYTFGAPLAGTTVNVAYGYTPADIEQAVIELTGERFRYMSRIGYNSKSLGGQETVSFDKKAMGPMIAMYLDPYTRVTPV